MTELKTESQSTRITQTQPTASRRSKKTTAPAETLDIAASSGKDSTSDAVEQTTATKKTRTARAKKTTQAASKPSNQTASTRVKLTWEPEPTPSIEAALEQFTEQLNANWVAIDELRATVEQMQARERQTAVRLPSDSFQAQEPAKAQPSLRAQDLPKAQMRDRAATSAQVAPPSMPKASQPSIPPFRPTSGFPTSTRQRRKKALHLFAQNILHLPTKTNEIAMDAALWVMAAAGLRVGLKYLVMAFPILELPVMLLVFVPALLAAYAALFIPKANRIGIYRLLLLALGLFVGGRL